MADKLTPKQEKYVQGLFAGLSQREAYKQAYNASRMKDATIDRTAHDLANDPKITARLEELQDELKERNMVTVEKVIEELAHIAFDDISNYLDYRTEQTVVDHDGETGEPIIDYKTIVELKDSNQIDTRSISEIQVGRDGQFKFKLYCKDNALTQLGKYLGMFKDNININGNIPIKIVDDIDED